MSDTATTAPESEDVLADVPTVLVTGFQVDRREVAGYEVVILGLDLDDGEQSGKLALALPAEDAVQIARALIHTASGTRPMSVQQAIIDLTTKETR